MLLIKTTVFAIMAIGETKFDTFGGLKMKKKDTAAKIISMICAVAVFAGIAVFGTVTSKEKKPVTTPNSESQSQQETVDNTPHKLTLLACGDNLIHNTIINSGKKSDGTYNFDSLYSEIKKEIEKADIAVLNQETILGGSDFEYSGYPLFNTPWEVGEAAINAGFDVFLNATNHTIDQRDKGVLNAIKFYEQHPEVTYLGINKDSTAYNKIKVVEKNGIKMAMLNYTFGLNGLKPPDDKPWLVNMLDKEKMLSDITAAKQIADVVIVFPHWGTEYSMDISTNQRELTQFFAENGVDLVIGTHPHVVEPIEEITRPDGKKMLVYYSLGNFISHQEGADRMLGAMANVEITKTGKDIEIKGTAKPIVTHYEKTDSGYTFKTYLLKDYTQSLAKKHRVSGVTPEYMEQLAKKVMGDFVEL